MRIGLLGGSFNPAHQGHRDISLMALRRLGLHQVWWLVSPQNPLKPVDGMAPFAERMARARMVASHPRIKISDLEARLSTRYTYDTLRALTHRRPHASFVWLMGADNLTDIARWQHWGDIFHIMPIAVFDRPHHSLASLTAKAAQRFAHARLAEDAASTLVHRCPPAWCFIHGKRNPLSATALRQRALSFSLNREVSA